MSASKTGKKPAVASGKGAGRAGGSKNFRESELLGEFWGSVAEQHVV
jgi:hypothetical protein